MLGKIENGQLLLAQGKVLRHDNLIVANPREEDWVAAGYKEVVDGKPLKEKEGFCQVPEYTEEDDKIKTTYRYEEITDDDL